MQICQLNIGIGDIRPSPHQISDNYEEKWGFSISKKLRHVTKDVIPCSNSDIHTIVFCRSILVCNERRMAHSLILQSPLCLSYALSDPIQKDQIKDKGRHRMGLVALILLSYFQSFLCSCFCCTYLNDKCSLIFIVYTLSK